MKRQPSVLYHTIFKINIRWRVGMRNNLHYFILLLLLPITNIHKEIVPCFVGVVVITEISSGK